MKLLIISNRETDLSKILLSVSEGTMLSPDETRVKDFDKYDALAILGGTEEKALILNAYLRQQCEEFADNGKPIFLEYVNSFGCVYSAREITMTPHRLVVCEDVDESMPKGALLDSRCNSYIHPHFLMPNTVPLMYYREITPAHQRLKDISNDDFVNTIAFFKSNNILSAAFRMCDYAKAGFSPKDRWDGLICYICRFLGAEIPAEFPKSASKPSGENSDINTTVKRALNLLKGYLTIENGSRGIKEGLSHNVLPDGSRILNENVRADCTGEAAGAFLFSFDEELEKIADNMYSFCYGPMVIKEGYFKGMMRWTEEAWNVCYQDDVARAIIPSLLYAYFGISDKYVDSASNVLEFLSRTTCKDGLRPARTDVLEYLKNGESVNTLAMQEKGYASAHYNSWYSAALLLGYAVTKNPSFLENGIKGLETLMSLYPDTVREHSETGEQCRMIFPLAVLYGITGDKKHYDMLDRVYMDLQARKHPSGAYAEWDTGYKSACFNNAGGECSLLSENGDPVADMLYSINWLPLGFAFAYLVTNEQRFLTAWQEICGFFVKTQMDSENKFLDGAWCRGIDLDTLEYCGVPHDVGWGPCSVETGWTVAEITMGMLIGKGIADGTLKRN